VVSPDPGGACPAGPGPSDSAIPRSRKVLVGDLPNKRERQSFDKHLRGVKVKISEGKVPNKAPRPRPGCVLARR